MKFKYISHRGNLAGKMPEYENRPDYLDKALNLGFEVETDLWCMSNEFFLGHDQGIYPISLQWLLDRRKKLWIHTKNQEAFCALSNTPLHYFWHESDLVTFTSQGIAWAYPGKQPIPGSISVLPEIHRDNFELCSGICSDLVAEYADQMKI